MSTNFDLRSKVELNAPEKRVQQDPVAKADIASAGYVTLDQAPRTGNKERRGLSPTSTYPDRYC